MDGNILQLLLLLVVVIITGFDGMNSQILMYGNVVTAGFLAGIIYGDPILGLEIGGTLQLMSLGIGAYGGASIPDYRIGAIIGTVVAIATDSDLAYGLTVAVPVSLLMIQLDVLVRTITTWFSQKAESYVDTLDYKKMYMYIVLGWIPWTLKEVIPITIVILWGIEPIQWLLDFLPKWFTGGMEVAAGLLPAVGIAILLKYMNLGKYVAYLVLGFVLMSYFDITMVGVGLIGMVLALISYNNEKTLKKSTVLASSPQISEAEMSGKVGIDEDEL